MQMHLPQEAKPRALTTIDLFSGTGALTRALHGIARPVLYCDRCPVSRALLAARMASNDLPRAPIADDVSALTGSRVPCVDMVVGGFPCVGFSFRGKRRMLDNAQSALFFQLVRVIRESRATVAFLENVPGVLSAIDLIRAEFSAMGFAMRWCVVGADDVGAPHKRRRWFCLAYKPDSAALASIAAHAVSPEYTPFDWAVNVPPRTLRLSGSAGGSAEGAAGEAGEAGKASEAAARKASLARWGLLGNGLVPDAARLAFLRILSGGRVSRLAPGTPPVRFVPVSATVSPATPQASPSDSVVDAAVGDAPPIRMSSVAIQAPDTARIDLVVDPAALPPPAIKCVSQTTPTLTAPVHRTRWATPRHGMRAPCRVLTARSERDLPTQIVFATDTANRTWPPNADFGDYLMGLPPGYTKLG